MKEKGAPQHDPIVVGLAEEVLEFMNEKCGRSYQFRDRKSQLAPHSEMIIARLEEGATPEQCRQIIVRKCREWKTDPKMRYFLRPATLFNRTNFHSYVGELGSDL